MKDWEQWLRKEGRRKEVERQEGRQEGCSMNGHKALSSCINPSNKIIYRVDICIFSHFTNEENKQRGWCIKNHLASQSTDTRFQHCSSQHRFCTFPLMLAVSPWNPFCCSCQPGVWPQGKQPDASTTVFFILIIYTVRVHIWCFQRSVASECVCRLCGHAA